MITDFIREKLHQRLLMENRIKFDIPIPNDIMGIKDVFVKHNYKAYLVGGSVRDSLLNKPIKDYDLVTDAMPDTVEQILKQAGYKTLPTGKAFGVINVFTDSDEYEIASFREDTSAGRNPTVKLGASIETDSARRDFSVNALYYDIETKEIIDLVDGVEDIKNGVIRTVGKPEERFKEDRLRILRFCRFSARFGTKLDPDVDTALKHDSSLEGISSERIRDEFIKGILSAKSVKYFLEIINRYGLFKWVFKGLEVSGYFIEERDPVVLLAILLGENDTPTLKTVLNKLTYTTDEIKAIVFLVGLKQLKINTAPMLKKAQSNTNLTDEQIKRYAHIALIDSQLIDAFIRYKLSINGQDVMDKMGIKAGPELGATINRLEVDNFKKLL